MKNNTSPLSAPSEQLIDAVMDCYVTWREASVAVDTAYANWRAAPLVDRTLLFAAYQAALDREERAAGDYQQMINQAAAAAA